MSDAAAILDALPRLGLVEAPSPVTALDERARRLGLGWLGIKRDDLLPALHGGAKVRKLDHLLAAPPWRDAPALGSVGAIGSGHLAALAAAGEHLGRPVIAETFWSPPTAHALENLAFLATRAEVRFHADRLRLGLARPAALRGGVDGEAAWIPPGGSAVEGALGLVRAGIELGAQVAAGLLPAPRRIVLPLGSGGLAAGLSVGLGMAGLRPVIHAVAVVEPWTGPALRLRRLRRALLRWLAERGIAAPEPAPIALERGWVGPGYGWPSAASWAAVRELEGLGLPADPAYTGKAWAALRAIAARHPGEELLFWETLRRGPLPVAPRWPDALPAALRRRLDETPPLAPGGALPRRRFLLGGAALLAAAGGLARVSGYRAFPAWEGALLSAWEAEVLRAAAEALLAPDPPPAQTLDELPRRADRFLAGLPEAARLEIHGLFVLIEHGTALDARPWRFTRLSPAERLDYLVHLSSSAPGHLVAKGLRDLVLLGWYQDPAAWAEIGYGGPLVPPERGPESRWEALRAPAGALPRSLA